MNKINRQELAKAIHENAVAKGFWGEKHSPEHYLMLVITELSEAVEAWRVGRQADPVTYDKVLTDSNCPEAQALLSELPQGKALWELAFERYIKDTIEDELADAYIRLLDFSQGYECYPREDAIQEVELYRERFVDEFKKIPFIESVFGLISGIVDVANSKGNETHDRLYAVLVGIEVICQINNIDLVWHITEKMRYNATRPHLHGKKC